MTTNRLDKFAIAAVLQEIASLLELKSGENKFKARAYRAGARVISGYSGDLNDTIERDQLTTIRGIGNALAAQIKQLYQTGTSSVLDGLRKDFPPGVLELATVPGLTLEKIRKLYQSLGISSIAELKKAAESGSLRNEKGFGVKTEAKLLESIENRDLRAHQKDRIHIHHAQRIGTQVLDYLRTMRDFQEGSFAGSLRRSTETVGTIRVVAVTRLPATLLQHFLRFPLIVRVVEQTENTCTVELLEGALVSIRVVPPAQYSLALLVDTGSRAHVQRLEQIAGDQNLRLDSDKLSLVSLDKAPSHPSKSEKGEAGIYAGLGMQYVPAELRENEGEVEAARKGKLPKDLIRVADIQGMVHCHTTYSDGVNSIEEMARAAEAMGMQYLTITDHSPTAFYANGVTLDRLQRQWDEIDEVQEKVSIKLLRGTESDIVADGSLDYPDTILERFDVIVASIHSRYKMDSDKMTKRLLTAMRQPIFKIWGHALGRLIQRRPPFECEIETVLDAISESEAAIEVNGDPYRLDLEARWIREARKRKIRFVISVDAHSTGALNNLQYGVGMARRGWVRRGQVLNTLGTRAFMNAVRPIQQ